METEISEAVYIAIIALLLGATAEKGGEVEYFPLNEIQKRIMVKETEAAAEDERSGD
ncbi:hypothetical protein AB4Z29_14180 [Paenibacillus sp. 2TAB23]|uniref:hypothetical protein n=1 Tax=Paenibacillus sp. 2TAB23 TaxID=3233004 RepID=UPI003F9CFF5F